MLGCHTGRNFQVSVAGGSYQDGLTSMIHGCPPGMKITEKEIYGDLLLRKPGADELSSPRKEPDLPIIYSGINSADTVEGAGNAFLTNATPLTILIPNLDRHFIHIKQYQDTNRTPRPGHASYATFMKYGQSDDAIGAGIFSGRYTSTIVAAGYVAKKILGELGINVFSFVREAAGVQCPEMDYEDIYQFTQRYKEMRKNYDPFYQQIYEKQRIRTEMRFLEKMAVLAEVENEIDKIRADGEEMEPEKIKSEYDVHHILCCPDYKAACEMVEACGKITKTGDSSGGIVEVAATGMPTGLGEPVFSKLDAELGKMLGIGAVKGVEIGAGFKAKDMTGHQCNDQIRSENGKVVFDSNNAGGITGGISSGQNLIARLAIKPTPTIDKDQHTIDKYTLENTKLSAITRRDPTIVGRIWPVAENYTAIVLLDNLMSLYGQKTLMDNLGNS
ncbi:chorismate synthase [Sedimentisphaera salicampi]|uniref:chorismate synthase n=1 Tax=Sedimentisphaera salicampi TaxID=1941349 RepID=UPI000B9B7BF8|nr:chorismate synthase [Sedimentisphaera salicampi]OXU15109.1 Chorismate synthase [Sedimentisphaera salicampi]